VFANSCRGIIDGPSGRMMDQQQHIALVSAMQAIHSVQAALKQEIVTP